LKGNLPLKDNHDGQLFSGTKLQGLILFAGTGTQPIGLAWLLNHFLLLASCAGGHVGWTDRSYSHCMYGAHHSVHGLRSSPVWLLLL